MADASLPRAFTAEERAVVARLRTPERVQRFLTALPYNPEDTVSSFRGVLARGSAHCLEGALFAATVLGEHGHPPVLLDLESQDLVDHVVLVYRRNRRFGAVGVSQFPGLHGRRAIYPTIRQLALSYYDPYVDETGRLTAYGTLDLRDWAGGDWRFEEGDLWDLHEHLLEMPHRAIPSSDARYERLRLRYRRFKARHPDAEPTYFRTAPNWLQ